MNYLVRVSEFDNGHTIEYTDKIIDSFQFPSILMASIISTYLNDIKDNNNVEYHTAESWQIGYFVIQYIEYTTENN